MGMKGKIPIAEIAIGDTDIWAVGPQAATGIYTSLWWYKNPDNPPAEQKMAADFLKKYGKPAADKAWMGWVTANSLFDSIEAAKSTDANAIIEALENWKGGTPENPYSYRKSDHQMMLKNLVVQVKPKIPDQWDYFDVKGDRAAELRRSRKRLWRQRLSHDGRPARLRSSFDRARPLSLPSAVAASSCCLPARQRAGARRPVCADRHRTFDHLRPAGHRELRARCLLRPGRLFRSDPLQPVRLAGSDPGAMCVGLLGMVIERLLIRHLYDKDPLVSLIVTFAFALMIEALTRVIWGGLGQPFNQPEWLSGMFLWGPVLITGTAFPFCHAPS